MKTFIVVVTSLLVIGSAQGQQARCSETHFSGGVTQGEAFVKDVGAEVEFSVNSMSLKEEPWWSWFSIQVIRRGDGIFVFQPSDANWSLAINNFGTSFIGGPRTDLRAALQYRSRYLLFPLSSEDLPKARRATELVRNTRDPDDYRNAVTALEGVPLGHAQFEIVEYGLAGNPPTTVEWLKFDVKLTVPSDFAIAKKLPVASVDCPAIPTTVLDDIRHPKRYEYFLSSME